MKKKVLFKIITFLLILCFGVSIFFIVSLKKYSNSISTTGARIQVDICETDIATRIVSNEIDIGIIENRYELPMPIYISRENNGIGSIVGLEFNKNDFSIIEYNENRYEIEIINNCKLNIIKENKNLFLIFQIDGKNIASKGHPVHSSRFPSVDFGYYFLIAPDGKPLLINENIIILHKNKYYNISNEVHFRSNID